MSGLRSFKSCLDAITAPTPVQSWLEAIPFTELKKQWAADDRCLEIQEQFWRNRCAMTLGESA